MLGYASSTDGVRTVHTFGSVLSHDEILKTRILEIAVHRMDLLDALGRERTVEPKSAEIVVGVLDGLLGAERPAALGWSDVEFIEAGTGRRPIEPAERSTLGPLADRFPLLG